MQVSVPRDAADLLAAQPALKSVLLVVPGDLASTPDVKRMRKRIWCLAMRRGVVPVSTTLAWQDGTNGDARTAFRIRRHTPVRTPGSFESAQILIAVKVNGLTRKQAAEKFGYSEYIVTRLVQRLSRPS